jgi:DNA-binding XRE family transcriptional regulator
MSFAPLLLQEYRLFALTQELFLHWRKLNRLQAPCAYAIVRPMDIKATRKAMGLTQAELAQKLGVDHSTVSRLENGKLVPSDRDLLAMEALLARHGATQ